MLDAQTHSDGTGSALEGAQLPNLSKQKRLGSNPGQQIGTPADWRQQLPRLAPLSLPLLPIGAGEEWKAPMNPATGAPLTGWTTAAYSAQQIQVMPPRVRGVGFRTGTGVLSVDIDGATAVALCLQQGCDPELATTWRVTRDTDASRLKVNWRLSVAQQEQLGRLTKKALTKRAVTDADDKVLEKAEAVEIFHHDGRQVVVLGEHAVSGGNYGWPDGHGPEALAPIPDNWWALVLAIKAGELGLSTGPGSAAPKPRTGAKSSSSEWEKVGTPSDPCPICRRNTTGYCSRNKVSHTIRCFHGSTFNPETEHGILASGNRVTGTDGVIYGFSGAEAQGDRGDVFSTFVVHKERESWLAAEQECAEHEAAAGWPGFKVWSEEDVAKELAKDLARRAAQGPSPGLELQQKPKRRTLAPDEVMAMTPARLGGVPRLNIRTNDFHAGGRTYTADDLSRLYVHLSGETERWPKDTTADVVVELAKDRAFDPVEEELNRLGETVEPLPLEQWQRLDQHLLGINDPIAAAFLPQFLISAVARVFRPGCGVRRAPVLIGPQWRGKTRLGRILFGIDHWVENVSDLGKDDLLRLQAGWGIELSELDGISRRKDVEAIKAFLTATQDVFRAPYGKGVSRYDRRCVFWGTSNGPPLRDLSGSTRFVCIALPDRMLPLDWAIEHRAAIWARAVEQFRLIPAGEEPWDRSTEEERQAIAERNLNFQQEDPWADEVAEILAKATDLPMTTPRILAAMDIPKSQQNNATSTRIRQLAELAGWVVARKTPLGSDAKKKGFWPADPGHTGGHTGHTGGHTEDTPAGASHTNGFSPQDTPDTPNQSNFEKKEEQGHSSAPPPATPEPPEACADTFELFGVSGVSTSPNTSEGLPSDGHTRCVLGVSAGVSSVCPAPKNATPEPPAWLPQALELRAANPTESPAVWVNTLYAAGHHGLNGSVVRDALAAHDQQVTP